MLDKKSAVGHPDERSFALCLATIPDEHEDIVLWLVGEELRPCRYKRPHKKLVLIEISSGEG